MNSNNIKLSLIIPIYNEKKYVEEVVNKIKNLSFGNISKEIVIVDDGSTDGTTELLKRLENSDEFKFIYHNK